MHQFNQFTELVTPLLASSIPSDSEKSIVIPPYWKDNLDKYLPSLLTARHQITRPIANRVCRRCATSRLLTRLALLRITQAGF